MTKKSGARIVPTEIKSKVEYILYLRHLFAYEVARRMIPKRSIVLDLGCGEGYGTYLLSKDAKKVIGLDVDPEIIDHASKKYSAPTISFELYDGTKIPYPDNYFDAITVFQVIEHVDNDVYFVSEIYRVLKPKGLVILTTPNRKLRLWSWQKPWNPYHKREYDPIFLRICLEKYFVVDIKGIKATAEIQQIEIKRLMINKLDFLNLRRFIPGPVKNLVKKILERERETSNRDWKYTVNDFYISEDANHALDILAICRKL